MELNWKIILIAGVAIVLLVAFGNNPVENARKAREEAKKGKDPLMESIREYNEKNPRRQSPASSSRPSTYPAPAASRTTGGTGYFGSGSNGNSNAPRMPDYMYKGGQPQTVTPQPQPGSASGYYPPPAPAPAPAPQPAYR